MPTTQSLSNRSPAGAIWRILCDQMSLNCRRTPPEGTGNRLRKERYYRKFRAPRGALRSCPTGLIAEAGLRWCGARPSSLTEDLNVKVCEEAVTLKICIVRAIC